MEAAGPADETKFAWEEKFPCSKLLEPKSGFHLAFFEQAGQNGAPDFVVSFTLALSAGSVGPGRRTSGFSRFSGARETAEAVKVVLRLDHPAEAGC
jgi:hypothetical protein